eukprot:616010-Pleurochrysis_carterae.AAC.1
MLYSTCDRLESKTSGPRAGARGSIGSFRATGKEDEENEKEDESGNTLKHEEVDGDDRMRSLGMERRQTNR